MSAVTALAVLLLVRPAAQAPAAVTADVEYGRANGKALLLDAYAPPSDGGERRPAVILIHGGGFRGGDKRSFEPEARQMAARGWVAFSVNYRLDEPSAFPAALDDVRAAVHWVRAHAAEYEVDPDRIGVLGESAGGTLAALLATTEPAVTAAVSWSGPMDLVPLAEAGGDLWGVPIMGCSVTACRDKFVEASPITQLDRDDAPLQLHNSEAELVPQAQAIAMAKRMDDIGYRGGSLRLMRGDRHALQFRDEAIGPSIEFLRQHLDRAPKSPASTVAFLVTLAAVAGGGALLLGRRGRRSRQREPGPAMPAGRR